MTRTANISAVDRSQVRFEVRDGIRRISCVVSNDALEAVSGLSAPSTVSLRRRSFDRFRTLINRAATLKLRSLPSGFTGAVLLTSRDLRCVPPEVGAPSFGSSARASGRSAAADDDDAPAPTVRTKPAAPAS